MTPARPPTAPIGYYWGDDAYSIERAAEQLARRIAGPDGEPLGRWRTTGLASSAALIGERVATGAMFGGGTIAIVREPLPLLRTKAARDELSAILTTVAPGNALAFLDPMERWAKPSEKSRTGLDASRAALAAAIDAVGGELRGFPAPKEGEMARWIEDRARERSVRLGPGAAQELAKRVGAFVREGDVDRRRQGQLAAAELDKLALYRLEGEVSVDDVRALVSEAIPASTWAFLDAVGNRKTREAANLLDRVLDVTPEPVLLVQLHRRLRELIEVADLLATGTRPADLPRVLKLNSYRAQILARQVPAWTLPELESALEGLLELDATVKGAGRTMANERGRRLAFALWLADGIAPH
jgi:DNA polymerase III delta subunit